MVTWDEEGVVMVRVLYTISILALVGAGIVFGFCLMRWLENGQRPEQVPLSSTTERFRDALATRGDRVSDTTSPLMRQAQTFASYLNPSPAPEPEAPRNSPDPGDDAIPLPTISPPTASPSFRLQGIVYCTSQPQTSMALISIGTGQMAAQRWVKEGTVVGHFIIQEIRPDVVICRTQNDEQIRELTVEAKAPRPSLVQRYVPELARARSPAVLGVTNSDVNAVSDGAP